MSHVATIEVEITNLQDLRDACRDLGLEFVAGQQTYRWYGESVGDYPLPEGFNVADLGRCQHAIRLTMAEAGREMERQRERIREHYAKQAITKSPSEIEEYVERPYEIGVVPRRDGKPGWLLLWDFFAGGFGLQDKIGPEAGLLKQAVATAASIRTMKQQGYRCHKEKLPNGTTRLQFVRG